MTTGVRLATRGAFMLGALGGVAVLLAWAGSSSTPVVGRQAAWGAVGVAGTFGVAAASVLWVVTLRGAVARRATELRTAILLGKDVRIGAGPVTAGHPVPRAPGSGEPVAALVATATMVRYHRPDCRLAAGKGVEPAERVEHERAGRAPCGVCRP
jgi:hypothetical protein